MHLQACLAVALLFCYYPSQALPMNAQSLDVAAAGIQNLGLVISDESSLAVPSVMAKQNGIGLKGANTGAQSIQNQVRPHIHGACCQHHHAPARKPIFSPVKDAAPHEGQEGRSVKSEHGHAEKGDDHEHGTTQSKAVLDHDREQSAPEN